MWAYRYSHYKTIWSFPYQCGDLVQAARLAPFPSRLSATLSIPNACLAEAHRFPCLEVLNLLPVPWQTLMNAEIFCGFSLIQMKHGVTKVWQIVVRISCFISADGGCTAGAAHGSK